MARAWRYSRRRNGKQTWHVDWFEPNGKRRTKTYRTKNAADEAVRRLRDQLDRGEYQAEGKDGWKDFRQEYIAKVLPLKAFTTQALIREALGHFERICSPKKLTAVDSEMIDQYKNERAKEDGKKKRDKVSPHTINKELRHLKAVFNKARKWKRLPYLPDFEMMKGEVKEKRHITPEHFGDIFLACDVATRPAFVPNVTPGDWWRALFALLASTGWRIGQALKERWSDVDLDGASIKARAADTKGKRDARIQLTPFAIEHLLKIRQFDPDARVFPWKNRRGLDDEFRAIQKAAGIILPCDGDHEHTDACFYYGFHDERRSFATLNFGEGPDRLSRKQLQHVMQHQSGSTTDGYINFARHLNEDLASKIVLPPIPGNQNRKAE